MRLQKKTRCAPPLAKLRAENLRLNKELESARAALASAEAEAERELTAFVSATSHDLRAPLRHIELFSQILIDDHAEQLPGPAVEGLGHLHSSSRKLGDRLDALTKLMRQTSGPLHIEPVDLAALLTLQIERVQARYPAQEVRCEPLPACWADCDHALIAILMDCLLDNAWRAMARSEHPALTIRLAHREGGPASLTIQDSGVGFEQRHASRLGTPFRKLHAEPQFPGMGVGLATAARILRRHGGSLSLTGAVGAGAAATLHLPTLRSRR
jgi:signal transduction histidine kinase